MLADVRLKDVFDEITRLDKSGKGQSLFFRPVRMELTLLFEQCQESLIWYAESLDTRKDATRLLSELPRKPEPTDWYAIQQLAADYLFLKLDEYSNGIDRPMTVTAPQAAAREQEVLRVQKPLAVVASILRSKGMTDEAEWLAKAAWHWELEICKEWGDDIIEVPRASKKHPLEVRGRVSYFAAVMNDLFDLTMPSIVAKLAGLAVPGIDVSSEDVETILGL